MVAPGVVDVMETVCAPVYVPPAGIKTGVALVDCAIVMVAEVIALGLYPVATATAETFTVPLLTVIGPLYTGDAVVGVEPSTV